jgi:hypothetical protein
MVIYIIFIGLIICSLLVVMECIVLVNKNRGLVNLNGMLRDRIDELEVELDKGELKWQEDQQRIK